MALNPVQVVFVNEVVRPHIERLIRFASELDAFIADYANQQTPLPTDGTVLTDGEGGVAARTNAPQLTGATVASLNTFTVNMRANINAAAYNALVAAAVRPVEAILRS
jgi:hypothetical protein